MTRIYISIQKFSSMGDFLKTPKMIQAYLINKLPKLENDALPNPKNQSFFMPKSIFYFVFQDGKSAMVSRPGFSPGMPPPRPSSSTGHNGSSGPPRGFEAKMISPHDSRSGYVKSSPLSETAESPSERLAHSKLNFLLVCKVHVF